MPAPTQTRSVDVTDLDYKTKPHEDDVVTVELRELSSKTVVTIHHGSEEWELRFSEAGNLTERSPAPPARPPRWLADVVAEAKPSLSLR